MLAFTNVFIAQVKYITLPYDNLFCLLILIIILITSITAFVRDFPAARPYLFANPVPIILMTGIGLLHIFTSINTTGDWPNGIFWTFSRTRLSHREPSSQALKHYR